MKTFTDENGQKFERVDYGGKLNGKDIVIRPIQEAKWKITSDISFKTPTSDYQVIQIELDVTEAQAQLIKDWISAGMAYVIGETGKHQSYVVAMDKARNAIQKDSE